MDLFKILGYLNKLSLLAFFVTLLVLGYQVYLLHRDTKKKKEKPVVPDFKENQAVLKINYTKIDPNLKGTVKREKNNNMIFLIVATVIVIISVFFSLFFKGSGNEEESRPSTVKLVISQGIKIYDGQWEILKDEDIANLKDGDKIMVAVESVPDPNVDKARIRINSGRWMVEDETSRYDKVKNLFYREYVVASNDAYIKAEAQLHSKVDGWLGE